MIQEFLCETNKALLQSKKIILSKNTSKLRKDCEKWYFLPLFGNDDSYKIIGTQIVRKDHGENITEIIEIPHLDDLEY